ncbi:MAG: DNA-3-methyladenine glycosylase I [Deltaproteobacteria bacterium]|nr:DNA-3-methyladenine glycosylase I [Deltaproteobacteria bacterium]
MEHFTGPRGEVDAFGNGTNTQAHQINLAMSTTPQTIDQISAKSTICNLDRIKQHMRYLIKLGFAVQCDSKWSLTESASLKYKGSKFDNLKPLRQTNIVSKVKVINEQRDQSYIKFKTTDQTKLFQQIDNIITRIHTYQTSKLAVDQANRSTWTPSTDLSDMDILKNCIELIAYSQRVKATRVTTLINTGIFDKIFFNYDIQAVANLNHEQLLSQYWSKLGVIWLPSKLEQMIGCAKAILQIQKQHSSFMSYLNNCKLPVTLSSDADIDLFWREFNVVSQYLNQIGMPVFDKTTSLCHLLMKLGYACIKPDSAVMGSAIKLGIIPAGSNPDKPTITDTKRREVVKTMQRYCVSRSCDIRILDGYLLIYGGQSEARTLVKPQFYQ